MGSENHDAGTGNAPQYELEMCIDGEFVAGDDGTRFDVVNPADGTIVGSAPDGNHADVDRAVAAAKEAYSEEWTHMRARERGRYLHRIADAIEARVDELARLETLENGKTLADSRSDVRASVEVYRFYAGAADKIRGDTAPEGEGVFDYTVREPYGVVGCIIPWNWPPVHTADFTAPQLAAGNTVVLKPAPETPLTSLRFAELWQDILPPGVVNVVSGHAEPGIRLSRHPGVQKLAFTGHTATGSKVMEAAAEHITDVMLELGGKNANIVLPDADLAAAAEGVYDSLFKNTGQACTAGSRLLIHEAVREEFMSRFIPLVEATAVGPGLDEESDIGPLASAAQYEKVTKFIELGQREGATVRYQGSLPPGLPDGHFVAPIVFDDVESSMEIAREEIFGPVLTVQPFSSVERAIEIANQTAYGLTTAIWTANIEAANRIARRVHSGIVFINNYDRDFLGSPFGGYKRSGTGRKLGFEETMREFTRVKTIKTAIAGSAVDLDEFYE